MQALTDREAEVLGCVARGSPSRQIARDLGISESTVKNNIGHILCKLGARNQAHAVVLAVRGGQVTLENRNEGVTPIGAAQPNSRN